jgi:hypothetical protein
MVRIRESGRGIHPNSKIGRRTVLGWQWQCGIKWLVVTQCECGRVQAVDTQSLNSGHADSCRCSRKPVQGELPRLREFGRGIKPGDKLGRRTVLGWQFSRGRDGQEKTLWTVVVECECGNVGTADVGEMARGKADSCGCLIAEAHRKHGFNDQKHGRHKLYSTWVGMRTRCNYPSSRHWKRYGGRGIKVCADWDHGEGFPAFLEWALSNGWQPDLQIDRIDNDGNYEPSNCQWATPTVQAQNKSTNRMLTAFGETKCVAEWFRDSRCAVSCIDTIYARIDRGMSHEQAISTSNGRSGSRQRVASSRAD